MTYEKLKAIWRLPIWAGSLPTLIHHLVHVCGGISAVGFFLSFDIEWIYAAIISTAIFSTVELLTALVKGNWSDSVADLWQYQAHWILYASSMGRLDMAASMLLVFLIGYALTLRWHYGHKLRSL